MTNFKKELPKWEAVGVTPPDSLQVEGWKAAQRPPADYFNWFFNKTYYALKELQEESARTTHLELHKNDKQNPHNVTSAQVGLGNVLNQKQATKVEFDAHYDDNVRHITSTERNNWNSKAAGTHTHQWSEILNIPFATLSNKGITQLVDSISSTDTTNAATPNSVKQAYDRGSTGILDAAAVKKITEDHIANKSNPHGTNKGHIGLGNVENYEVASVSEAQTGTTINKYMTPLLVFEAIKTLQAVKSVNGKVGAITLTKADIGLSNVDNIQQATKTEFNGHTNNKSNPHGVTTEQIGTYGKSDIDLKINGAQNTVQTNLTTHINNKNNPHETNKSDVGLGNVENIKQASKVEFDTHATSKSNPHSVTAAQTGAYSKIEVDSKFNAVGLNGTAVSISNNNLNDIYNTGFYMGSNMVNAPSIDWHYVIVIKHNELWQTQIAINFNNGNEYTRVRVNNIWNGWAQKETTVGAQTKANVVQTNLNNHTNNKSNPHDTNKSDVGLANVDNVKQASKVEFDSHTNNKSNPHNTTKAHVGLGNVDNIQQATKVEFNTHNTDNIRHITSTERSNWNGKANTVLATQSSNGLMSSGDKKKLDELAKSNKVFYSGASFLMDDQSYSIDINEIKDSLVIVFGRYSSTTGKPEGFGYVTHSIPKADIIKLSGKHRVLPVFGGDVVAIKQVYISEQAISGHKDNKSNNSNLWVLEALYAN